MKNDLTELVFILDKSGSMSGLEKDTIGGFNSLIEKQKKEKGEAIVSTVLFNDEMDVINDRVNIQEVPKLTDKEYFVCGCTALLDAIGNSINHIIHVHNNLKDDECPSKTLFIITTDGMENSSHEYNYKIIKSLIDSSKEKQGFEYIFLGANIDSEEEASKLGIDKDQAVTYKCDDVGVGLNYEALDCAIAGFRSERKLSKKWRESIDKDVKKRGK